MAPRGAAAEVDFPAKRGFFFGDSVSGWPLAVLFVLDKSMRPALVPSVTEVVVAAADEALVLVAADEALVLVAADEALVVEAAEEPLVEAADEALVVAADGEAGVLVDAGDRDLGLLHLGDASLPERRGGDKGVS